MRIGFFLLILLFQVKFPANQPGTFYPTLNNTSLLMKFERTGGHIEPPGVVAYTKARTYKPRWAAAGRVFLDENSSPEAFILYTINTRLLV